MASLEVQEVDDDYRPVGGLNITYRTDIVYTAQVGLDQWFRQPGFVVQLRNDNTILAQVELTGSRRDARDVADEISFDDSLDYPWFATLRTLSDALRTERSASRFAQTLGVMLGWQHGRDPDTKGPNESLDEQDVFEWGLARDAKALLTCHVPADLRNGLPLHEATEEHVRLLHVRAARMRAAAAWEMPDPDATARPQRWIADYSPQEARGIRDLDRNAPLRPWLADLPHRLLRCWGELSDDERRELGVGRRNALLDWAVAWDLPKTAISAASGIARTTIDRNITVTKGAS